MMVGLVCHMQPKKVSGAHKLEISAMIKERIIN